MFCLLGGSEAITVYINANLNARYDQTTIKVEPTTTMRQIKQICANKYGLPYEELMLKYSDAQELSDESTIESNDIKEWGALRLIEKRTVDPKPTSDSDAKDKNNNDGELIRIGITSTGGWSSSLEINSNKTIKDLKELIERVEAIEYHMQKLYFNNGKLEDDRTLKSYNIKNDSTVHLVFI